MFQLLLRIRPQTTFSITIVQYFPVHLLTIPLAVEQPLPSPPPPILRLLHLTSQHSTAHVSSNPLVEQLSRPSLDYPPCSAALPCPCPSINCFTGGEALPCFILTIPYVVQCSLASLLNIPLGHLTLTSSSIDYSSSHTAHLSIF